MSKFKEKRAAAKKSQQAKANQAFRNMEALSAEDKRLLPYWKRRLPELSKVLYRLGHLYAFIKPGCTPGKVFLEYYTDAYLAFLAITSPMNLVTTNKGVDYSKIIFPEGGKISGLERQFGHFQSQGSRNVFDFATNAPHPSLEYLMTVHQIRELMSKDVYIQRIAHAQIKKEPVFKECQDVDDVLMKLKGAVNLGRRESDEIRWAKERLTKKFPFLAFIFQDLDPDMLLFSVVAWARHDAQQIVKGLQVKNLLDGATIIINNNGEAVQRQEEEMSTLVQNMKKEEIAEIELAKKIAARVAGSKAKKKFFGRRKKKEK